MKCVQPDILEAYCAAVLQGHGVETSCAETVANCLVDADLHGVSTHGVSRLGIYLERLNAGVVEKKIQIQKESPSALVVDAGC